MAEPKLTDTSPPQKLPRGTWCTTHGGAKKGKYHPLYATWLSMRKRCSNPNHKDYGRYGGRGMAICSRWGDFRNFADDMGPRPPGRTLDRINNDGNYEPANCRWATRAQQVCNTSRNHILEWRGKAQSIKEWAAEIGIPYRTLASRVKYGWPVEKMMTRPVARWLAKGIR